MFSWIKNFGAKEAAAFEALAPTALPAASKAPVSLLEEVAVPHLDAATLALKAAGTNTASPADLIRAHLRQFSTPEIQREFEESVATGDYQKFPFCDSVAAAVRGQALLGFQATSKEALLQEFFTLLPQFMRDPEQVKAMEAIVAEAKAKLPARMRVLVENEKILARPDDLDYLALSDLVQAMKGGKVAPLFLGTGFMAKLMEEAQAQTYDGFLFKIQNDALTEIKLVRVPQRGIHYSPVEAATLLYFDHVKFRFEDVPHRSLQNIIKMVTDKYDGRLFEGNTKYFVVVDGCVAIPSAKEPYVYEGYAKNDERLAAAEVFLFEQADGKIRQTRTAFLPYDLGKMHPLHRHGTLIFGSNDQSFQSCYRSPKDFAHQSMDDYKAWWHEQVKADGASEGDAYSPAVQAARLHWFLKDREGKPADPTYLFWDENIHAQELVLHSIAERTEFTKYWMLKKLPLIDFDYSGAHQRVIRELCANEAPLNRRWSAKQFIADGSGITLALQPTFYAVFAQRMLKDKYQSNFALLGKLMAVKDLEAAGVPHLEALARVFGSKPAA